MIAGIIGKTTTSPKISKMLKLLRHRGSNNSAIRTLKNGAVGCGELEFSPQATPALCGEKEPFVLLEGDLYNPRSPSEMSNVALLRELYLKHGKKCFSMLDGSWSCAIIDENNEVILARDSIGARPLIYGTKNNELYFASEAKALVDHSAEVYELAPGYYYSSKEGLQTFPGFTPKVPDFETPEEAAKILRELVIEAVKKRMKDGSVEGVSISGGLDSSVTAAVAKKFNPNLKLFSTTTKRYPGEDIEYAKLMASYLGLEHHIYRITDHDIARIIPRAVWYLESYDEDCITGIISNFYTSRMVSKFTNCTLVGEGADELFGGYFRELKKVSDPAQKEKIARKLLNIAYNTALRRLDRGWMANSVHYRAPFLDSAVVTFSHKIPMELKVKYDRAQQREVEKWILREAFRDYLPPEVADRPKLRFARGVGVDNLIDEITASKVSKKELEKNPKTQQGIVLNSPKELYFYRIFRRYFPAGYENLMVRWDPFK